MRTTWRHYALPLMAVLIWSGNTIVSKLAAGAIAPSAISFYRWLIAALCMTPFVWRELVAARVMIWRDWPRLAVLGFLGMVAYQCLAYIAARSTTATNMGLLLGLLPLMTVGLSVLWLAERVTRGDVAGGLLSLAGLVYLLSQGHPASLLAHGVSAGDGIMLLACAAYAAYCVLLKRWPIALNRWASLCLQIWFAVGFLSIYYLVSGAPAVTRAGWPLMLYAAIPASLMAPMLWLAGVQALGPQRTTALMNLMPVVTVALACWSLGEALHGYHLLGGGLVLAGVVLVQRWTRPLRATVRREPLAAPATESGCP
ncbi:DMT family transporter [Paludibacterium purpuratum]|uniref:Drug/metabolite transporter (DMT)-like permease n=1 Tax=Paludibacterium purpuratum TaxID=1144873 RepID=A0A4R7BGJ5_9NEIS|nr:DMT family transporter [Paludibacterium purpuratum]TDR82887.1 drug/metabolite transporter (DMT)-like permease [Paludibacterium purpuratum]